MTTFYNAYLNHNSVEFDIQNTVLGRLITHGHDDEKEIWLRKIGEHIRNRHAKRNKATQEQCHEHLGRDRPGKRKSTATEFDAYVSTQVSFMGQYWSSDKGLFQALKSLLTFVHTKSKLHISSNSNTHCTFSGVLGVICVRGECLTTSTISITASPDVTSSVCCCKHPHTPSSQRLGVGHCVTTSLHNTTPSFCFIANSYSYDPVVLVTSIPESIEISIEYFNTISSLETLLFVTEFDRLKNRDPKIPFYRITLISLTGPSTVYEEYQEAVQREILVGTTLRVSVHSVFRSFSWLFDKIEDIADELEERIGTEKKDGLHGDDFAHARGVRNVPLCWNDEIREVDTFSPGPRSSPRMPFWRLFYGTDWWQKDKHTYCRRKKLIDEINRISQAEKRDPLEVVQSADNERVARGKNLNWMWEHWVKERREGRE
ncbi:hypothetical protein V8E54_002603 [Elaphomyces granulatus]